jgi:paraquat-inducible protein B
MADEARTPPEPVVARRRTWLPSLIWLIPVVVALVGITLVVRFLTERGPTITITFRTAEGIQAGKTAIKYKEVDIGTVQSVRLAEDRSGVVATVQLFKEARSFTAADTRFWVVRPRAEATGISGLSTLLSGAYIGADAGASTEVSSTFEGLEAPPIVTRDDSGRQFVLHASDLGSLDIGSPVYFRRIKVGQVAAYALNPDGQGVTLRIFVNAPYEQFVGANTRFWHASGFDVQLDAGGFRLRTQSLATVVLGGIAFHAPDGKPGPAAAENTAFDLAADEGSALAPDNEASETMLMYFDQSLRGLTPGAQVDFRGVVLGHVKSIGVEFVSEEGKFRMPVLVQVFPERLRRESRAGHAGSEGAGEPDGSRRRRLQAMIERGRRAQLRLGNLLTGQLYIALDFFPNAPASAPVATTDPLEVPTVPNSLDELQSQIGEIAVKLNKVPYEQIGKDLQQTMQTLDRMLRNADRMVKGLHDDVSPQITAAMKDVRRTLGSADKTLEAAGKAMTSAQRTIAEDAPLQQELRQTLREISRSAASLRILTDYLEQHPESLLRGKPRDSK